MSLVQRDALSRRSRSSSLTYRMLRELASIGGNYGKRVLASGNVPGGLGGAAAAAGVAAAAARSQSTPAKRAKVLNTPQPRFNPGGAGGYLVDAKKVSKKKKRKLKLSPEFKKAIKAIVKKNTIPWELISKIKFSDCFAVWSSSDFPMTSASPITNDRVGWYFLEHLNIAEMKAYADAALRRDAYGASGTSNLRNVPFGNTEDNQQKEFKFNMGYDILLKNNTSQTLYMEIFEVVCKGLTNIPASTELSSRYNNAYLTDPVVVATPSDPPNICTQFDLKWSTPFQKGSTQQSWKKSAHRELCLNPGDECRVSFKHSTPFSYDSSATTYMKGSHCLVMRLQGSLSHSDANPKLVHFSAALCDVQVKRTVSLKVRDSLYTGQKRILANSHDAFTDDVVGGDATQHVVAT